MRTFENYEVMVEIKKIFAGTSKVTKFLLRQDYEIITIGSVFGPDWQRRPYKFGGKRSEIIRFSNSTFALNDTFVIPDEWAERCHVAWLFCREHPDLFHEAPDRAGDEKLRALLRGENGLLAAAAAGTLALRAGNIDLIMAETSVAKGIRQAALLLDFERCCPTDFNALVKLETDIRGMLRSERIVAAWNAYTVSRWQLDISLRLEGTCRWTRSFSPVIQVN